MCTHKVDIPLNAIVEVVLVDEVQQPNLSHPFHLHGYSFNVIGIGRSPDTTIKKINLKHALDLDRRGLLHRQYDLPPAKDTIAVPNNGYVVFRFRADNPGWVGVVRGHSKLKLTLIDLIWYSQSMVVPLSLPLPRDHRHELNLTRRNSSWFATRAAKLPHVRRSFVSLEKRNFLKMFWWDLKTKVR